MTIFLATHVVAMTTAESALSTSTSTLYRDPDGGASIAYRMPSTNGIIYRDLDIPLLEGWTRCRLQSPANYSYFDTEGVTLVDNLQRKLFGIRFGQSPARIDMRRYTGASTSVDSGGMEAQIAVYYYLDLNWKIHATEGFVRAYVNNLLIASFEGNTKIFADTTGIQTVRWLNQSGVGTPYIYNMIIADQDTRGMLVRTLQNNAAGSVQQMTGAYTDVTKTTKNDTTGLVSGTADQITTVNLASAPTAGSGPIKTVVLNYRALKGETGPQTINPLLRVGGVNYHGADQALKGFADNYAAQWDVNPATGNQWTLAELVALEAGVRSRA